MKRKVKTLLASLLILIMLVQTFAGAGLEVKADETTENTYTEMKFSDWGTLIQKDMYGTNAYKLIDAKSDVTSLNGVAVSGTVNFNGVDGARIRIGGNDNHRGFAFVNTSGCLKVLPEEIGGNTTAQTVIDATEWATLKNQDMKFRAAFYKEESNWYIAVYINDEFKGPYNCGNATPGTSLAYSVDTTTKAQQVTVRDIDNKEMKFSDWGTRVSNAYANVYKLIDAKSSSVSTLDGIAVSGTVNFNGVANAFIRIGGKDNETGFAFIDNRGFLKVTPQAIGGTTTAYTVIAATEWATLKNQDMKFRAAFYQEESNWYIAVYINDEFKGTYNCGAATPGTSLAYSINTTGAQQVTVRDIDNKEMKFSDWGTRVKNAYANVYKLIDAKSSSVSTLDGIAVSGTVNFNGVANAFIRIGGKDNETGFAFIDNRGCLKVTPQGIAGTTTAYTVIDATEWATLKNQDMKFRAAFYQEENNWYIAVYINDEFKGTYNCGAATPGTSLAYSINTTGAQQVTVRDIDNTEMKFSDWVFYTNMYESVNVYKLVDGRSDVTSLDGVAISGTLNFNGGNGARIRIGGKDTAKHGGFAFGDINGGLMVVPEVIGGTTTVQTVVSSKEWETLKSENFKFRAAFYKEQDSNWYIAVYINDEFKGTYNCGAATPGTYMAYIIDTSTKKEKVTVSNYGYTEMRFSDWTKSANSYSFTGYTTYLYALPDNSSIKSLDDIAISGKVNFNEIKNHQISVGGIDTQRYVGFWLRATDEDAWNLSAQGIGAGASVTMRGEAISFNQDIILRMTFDEVTTNSWMVCVYANGTYVGSKTFAGVTPGLYIGIPEDVTVEGKNTVYELSGTETTYEESGTTYDVGEYDSEDKSQRVVVYKLGDANKDAICNVADLVRMKKYTTELETARIKYTLAAKLASDFDKDSQLSDNDTKLLREHILLNGELGKRRARYGIGERVKALDDGQVDYATTDFVTDMTGAFGAEVFRVWMLNIGEAIPDGKGGYIVTLKQGELVKVQELVAKLKDNGVKQIVALQGPLIPYDFPKFVGQSGQSYSQEDIDNGSHGDDTLIRADKYAFPEPGTPEYDAFMNVQVEYYRQLSEALPDITHFEGVNEPEKGGSVHKIGWLSSDEQKQLLNQSNYNLSDYEYTITEIAQITMDYNHAITEGVRKANTGAKVLSSGLMTIALTKTYLTEAYKYITSETNYYKDKNPDHYFEILNWHPYVFIGTNEDKSLPYSTAATWDKENWADTWVQFQKDLYQIAKDNGDGDTPVWFTEFGISDCTGTDKSYEQNITETMTSIRLQDMFDLVEKELDFVNTVIVFRMFDLQDGTNTAYECNFGMIEYFGNINSSQAALKKIGKTFYRIVNKSNDYTKVNTVLDKYYKQFGY